MRIAFVSTVKNEEDLIAANIGFHTYIGGTDFLLYMDGSSDSTEAIARATPGTRVRHSSLPAHLRGDPRFANLVVKFDTHHTARQILNCYEAIDWGRGHGVDWMVSLDPDELICLDKNILRKDMLAEFLSALPDHVDAVTFPSLEVVPTGIECVDPFLECRWFKTNYGFGEGGRYSAQSNSVDLPSRGGDEYPAKTLDGTEAIRKWRIASRAWGRDLATALGGGEPLDRVLDVPPTIMRHVGSGRVLVTDWYGGHVIGKQAFRIDRELRIANLHKIVTESNRPEREISAGCLLHYNNFSARKFVMKYRQSATHPDTYASGFPVDPAKRLLRDLVNRPGMPMGEIYRFFGEHFVIDCERFAAATDLWPQSILRIDVVSEFFRSKSGRRLTRAGRAGSARPPAGPWFDGRGA